MQSSTLHLEGSWERFFGDEIASQQTLAMTNYIIFRLFLASKKSQFHPE